MKGTPLGLLVLSLAVAGVLVSPLLAQSTTRVSVSSAGIQGNNGSYEASISSDGRYLAFYSSADDLVPGDTNLAQDVYVHDRLTGQTTRISVDSLGMQGSGDSNDPSFSADGRYVAFESAAANLLPGDTNGTWDVFVHDRQTGQIIRASVDSTGVQGNSFSFDPSLSADGRYVAFRSHASNLVPGDTNGWADVFVHDRQTGLTSRVSVSSLGAQGNASSSEPVISADGGIVAFRSLASNLVPGDTNLRLDVYVHDRSNGQTTRTSVDSLGLQANSDSSSPSLSGDARYVAFQSHADNLVPGDTNGWPDVFVHDRLTGQTTRISVDSAGVQGNGLCLLPSISSDGCLVAFSSAATNLVPGDTNGWSDVFVHDRLTGQTTRISVDSAGVQGNGASSAPSISSDGRYLAFHSSATDLVPGDTNLWEDVFVHDRLGPSLIKTGACPGPMTFTASGVMPGNSTAFVWGTPGTFTIPAGKPCAGVLLDLVPLLTPPPGYIVAAANSSAIATVTANVPAGACSALLMQALDLTICATTNTMSF